MEKPIYTPTEWSTIEDKAKFERQFKRFVLSDFKRTLFPKWFYTRLSNTFSHIAHYNQGGFFDTFFTSTERKVDFLRHTLQGGGYGNPAYTYSDVERVLKAWVMEQKLVEKYETILHAETETSERAQYEHLKAKYA